MKKFCIILIVLLPLSLYSQVQDQHIDVHFYPHSLSPEDNLQDGPFGRNFNIREDTFLIWVDLHPGMFFTHETAYILISQENVRIKRGNWWPVLNGKTILHNEHKNYALISPFELPLVSVNGYMDEKIEIHVYPHELTSQDRLTDGPLEKVFRLDDNCLLVWADFLPGAFFAHPTAYILISKENIWAENGLFWPELNGKKILYGQLNKTGIISPFKLSGVVY
jgi:hypothetical protein